MVRLWVCQPRARYHLPCQRHCLWAPPRCMRWKKRNHRTMDHRFTRQHLWRKPDYLPSRPCNTSRHRKNSSDNLRKGQYSPSDAPRCIRRAPPHRGYSRTRLNDGDWVSKKQKEQAARTIKQIYQQQLQYPNVQQDKINVKYMFYPKKSDNVKYAKTCSDIINII